MGGCPSRSGPGPGPENSPIGLDRRGRRLRTTHAGAHSARWGSSPKDKRPKFCAAMVSRHGAAYILIASGMSSSSCWSDGTRQFRQPGRGRATPHGCHRLCRDGGALLTMGSVVPQELRSDGWTPVQLHDPYRRTQRLGDSRPAAVAPCCVASISSSKRRRGSTTTPQSAPSSVPSTQPAHLPLRGRCRRCPKAAQSKSPSMTTAPS